MPAAVVFFFQPIVVRLPGNTVVVAHTLLVSGLGSGRTTLQDFGTSAEFQAFEI